MQAMPTTPNTKDDEAWFLDTVVTIMSQMNSTT